MAAKQTKEEDVSLDQIISEMDTIIDDITVAAFLMTTPRDFNDVNGSMIRKLNSDLFSILKF